MAMVRAAASCDDARARVMTQQLLAYSQVGESSAEQLAFVLHGALGAGHNFRSFMRRLSQIAPAWRFVLVDLRNHGASQGMPPPHTLAACAADLQALALHVGQPRAVIGHSFGGKVALRYASLAPPGLSLVWVLDSNPGAQVPDADHEVLRVIEALRRAPSPAPSREHVVQALQSQGLPRGLATWATTNLKRTERGYEWQLDFAAISELMHDYFSVDLWPYLAEAHPGLEFHLVMAEHSARWTGDMRERVRTLPPEARVQHHVLPNAGHWVHVDNPDGLLELMAPSFEL